MLNTVKCAVDMVSLITIDIDDAIRSRAYFHKLQFNGAGGVMAEKDGFHACPSDGFVELPHSPC
jgi:hypothetical protein